MTISKIIKIPAFSSLWDLVWEPMMNRPNYESFPLLLYLEWLLLGTVALMEILLPFQLSWSLLVRMLTIALFGAMSFILPIGSALKKSLYTALEFGLIFLLASQDNLSPRSIFLLSLVLVLRNCVVFRQTGQWIVLSLALIFFGTLFLSRPIAPQHIINTVWNWRLNSVLMFALTLVFALLLVNALLAERQSREQLEIVHAELAIAHDQLRQYALRIENQATLQERNRIAREIHDGLGHTLAAQTIQINNALLFWESSSEKALSFVKAAKQLGAEALLEVRRSVSVLRSNPLQGKSLESAIQKLLADFQQTTGIVPSCTVNLSLSLSPEINTTLYRIVQESLTNISKHALATAVAVEVHQHAGIIHLSIEDNGRGFNPSQNTTGFGLQGMRERTAALGGEFNLYSQPKAGCRISIAFPLSKLLP
ncbi:MAG: sensor histidine kinase [Microcoleus sp.]